jgi:linoleoyl-CoA desaturase
VEHHLFPKISHVHYPALSQIVKQTAEEHGIPYLENESLLSALQSHFRYMREIGTLPNPNTAIN